MKHSSWSIQVEFQSNVEKRVASLVAGADEATRAAQRCPLCPSVRRPVRPSVMWTMIITDKHSNKWSITMAFSAPDNATNLWRLSQLRRYTQPAAAGVPLVIVGPLFIISCFCFDERFVTLTDEPPNSSNTLFFHFQSLFFSFIFRPPFFSSLGGDLFQVFFPTIHYFLIFSPFLLIHLLNPLLFLLLLLLLLFLLHPLLFLLLLLIHNSLAFVTSSSPSCDKIPSP